MQGERERRHSVNQVEVMESEGFGSAEASEGLLAWRLLGEEKTRHFLSLRCDYFKITSLASCAFGIRKPFYRVLPPGHVWISR